MPAQTRKSKTGGKLGLGDESDRGARPPVSSLRHDTDPDRGARSRPVAAQPDERVVPKVSNTENNVSSSF